MFKVENLPCVLYRNPVSMVFCGYVGIPKGHHRYKHCLNIRDYDCQFIVHGGITYSEAHLPRMLDIDFLKKDFWWLGFDCGHLGCDYVPNLPISLTSTGPKDYKTVQYAKSELTSLANQIAEYDVEADVPSLKIDV